MPLLTDTHCHLDFEAFASDRAQVLSRAWGAGLVRVLVPGIDLPSSRAAVRLAESDSRLFAAVGVHPNSALAWGNDSESALRELATHPRVVAIGEVGLDFYRDRTPREVQIVALREQLDLAAELELPVVIHNREATEPILDLLTNWQAGLANMGSPLSDRPGVLHSFSADLAAAERAVQAGFFLGFTGPVTFRKASETRSVVAQVPLKRILIETDAPFLTPMPFRGRRNEPAYVRYIADKIAEVRGQPLDEIGQATTSNAARLFNWGDPL